MDDDQSVLALIGLLALIWTLLVPAHANVQAIQCNAIMDEGSGGLANPVPSCMLISVRCQPAQDGLF